MRVKIVNGDVIRIIDNVDELKIDLEDGEIRVVTGTKTELYSFEEWELL